MTKKAVSYLQDVSDLAGPETLALTQNMNDTYKFPQVINYMVSDIPFSRSGSHCKHISDSSAHALPLKSAGRRR